ncbi:MAG: adenylate/guanylate cyclase domain-containing protein [Bacteroidota bacterium]
MAHQISVIGERIKAVLRKFRSRLHRIGEFLVPTIVQTSSKVYRTLTQHSLVRGPLHSSFQWARRHLVQLMSTFSVWASSGWEQVVDFFMRMKIRLKLSIIVGTSIALVAFAISSITLKRQEKELRAQTEIVGRNIVQSLADLAEDNLLLNSFPILQDYVKNFSKREIRGLEVLYLLDRNGLIVAHLNADSVNRFVSPKEWDQMAGADTLVLIETPTHLQYLQPIFVVKSSNKEVKKILLGGASASFSKAVLLAPIEDMKRMIVFTSVIVSVVVIYLVFLLSGRIVHIIIALSEAARRVGLGDLKVTVVTRIKDEVGTLANEFNHMVHQIREKTEMEKFVSRSTLRMLSEGKLPTLGGTRRVISVLFTDIRDFTAITETLWPEEVVVSLNHYLDLQTRVIDEHHGVVDKFMGDGIMSIFEGEDMAYRAVSAAICIQEEIARMNKERQEKNEVVLAVGIGIANGRAVLGNIGSRDRMDFTAIGDPVNLASRLCRAAGAFGILVSHDVVTRLNGRFSVKPEQKVVIKGKRGRVSVYQVPLTLS